MLPFFIASLSFMTQSACHFFRQRVLNEVLLGPQPPLFWCLLDEAALGTFSHPFCYMLLYYFHSLAKNLSIYLGTRHWCEPHSLATTHRKNCPMKQVSKEIMDNEKSKYTSIFRCYVISLCVPNSQLHDTWGTLSMKLTNKGAPVAFLMRAFPYIPVPLHVFTSCISRAWNTFLNYKVAKVSR